MSKKADEVFKSSTDQQQKLNVAQKVIRNVQVQIANFPKEHRRIIDEQELCLVESDMEKSEKIAGLENDCNEAIEELNVSTLLVCNLLLFCFHVAQFFHLLIFQ
jgi:hypothetical protein